jgi:hypothetical protein
VETDAQEFDCETCPVRDAMDELWPDNRAAWVLYQSIMSRFTYDCGLVGDLVREALDGQDFERRLETIQRLGIIYSALMPVTAKPDGA